MLRTVYDPEIPVNIYDLGLIYKVDVKEDGDVDLDMTFTAPSCPAAEFMLEDVRQKVEGLEMVKTEAKKIVAKAKKAVKEAMQTVDTEVKKTTKSAWKSRKNIEMD